MTTYARRALLVALSAAVAATTLATSATASVPSWRPEQSSLSHRPSPSPPSPPALTWRACPQPQGPADQECADLSVPLDYGVPAGPHLTVAVARLRGRGGDDPSARRGTLLMIPGGPGGSGVRALAQKGAALRAETGGTYDIVSFDPRGAGGSTKAGCGLDEGDRHLVTLRSWPDADGGIAANVARSRRTAEACARNGGAVLRSFSAENEARDIDTFRQALGERKLSAWGVSYGTYVGALYAQKYPQHTDRWVLDSSGDPDPDLVERGWLANMAPAAEDRFPDFAAWAADPARAGEGLRLARRAEEVRPLILALAEKLDREPKKSATEGVPLTGNRLRQELQSALYSDSLFPRFARLVLDAETPGAEPVLSDDIARALPDEAAAASIAYFCNDVRWPGRVAAYERAVAADRARNPLTAGMPANITPCAFWKDAPAGKPTRITGDGPSNILMIQGLRDPATPYFGALRMREALADRARLVTVEHGGHGVYLGNGNPCGDRAVSRFLTTGERPARDTYCAD
ncbi:alpha/beta hydrolase [Streptomyces sp. NPDC088258]|uniref:alpha/beta hydrolase n=1 Tax=Streptomyces sp. NPDC088258 TaxID=3365849 RepID=UPI0038192AC5